MLVWTVGGHALNAGMHTCFRDSFATPTHRRARLNSCCAAQLIYIAKGSTWPIAKLRPTRWHFPSLPKVGGCRAKAIISRTSDHFGHRVGQFGHAISHRRGGHLTRPLPTPLFRRTLVAATALGSRRPPIQGGAGVPRPFEAARPSFDCDLDAGHRRGINQAQHYSFSVPGRDVMPGNVGYQPRPGDVTLY